MKIYLGLLVLAISFSVSSIPAIAQGRWFHKKVGTTAFSKERHLSLEVDSMGAGANCTAASHKIAGLGGTVSGQWGRACYKLEVDPEQNEACEHFTYIGDMKTDTEIVEYISTYYTLGTEMNLLGAHRYKLVEHNKPNEHAGLTWHDGKSYTMFFAFAGSTDGQPRSANFKIAVELHENACHDGDVGAIGHCTDTECSCAPAVGDANTAFCGSKTTGCLKKLIEYPHVDD